MAVTIRNSLVGSKMFSFSGSLVFFSRPRMSFFFSKFLDKDECQSNNGGCDYARGLCINTPGSYHCACKQGYELKENSEFECEGEKQRHICSLHNSYFLAPYISLCTTEEQLFFLKMVNGNGLAASNSGYHLLSSSSLGALNIVYFECDVLSFPSSHFLPPAKLEPFSSV